MPPPRKASRVSITPLMTTRTIMLEGEALNVQLASKRLGQRRTRSRASANDSALRAVPISARLVDQTVVQPVGVASQDVVLERGHGSPICSTRERRCADCVFRWCACAW